MVKLSILEHPHSLDSKIPLENINIGYFSSIQNQSLIAAGILGLASLVNGFCIGRYNHPALYVSATFLASGQGANFARNAENTSDKKTIDNAALTGISLNTILTACGAGVGYTSRLLEYF